MKPFSSLKATAGYPYLLLARATSSIILWVDFTLIFSNLSYFWHASASTIGIASALYGLPGLLLGPFFGRFADTHHPLSVLRSSYVCRGVTSLLLMFAPNQFVFVLFVFLKGLSNLGAMPAEQILVRSMLTPSQLVDNARWMTTIDQLVKIAAPLLGAVMASLYEPVAGFGLSATLSVAGIVFLLLLQRAHPFESAVSGPRKSPRLGALAGLLRTHAGFRHAFIASLVQTAVLGLYDPLLALFLRAQGFPAATFGAIVSCTAAGGIAGAMLFKRAFSSGNTTRVLAIGLIGFGVTVFVPGTFAALHVPVSKYVLFASWLANGACYGVTAMSFGVVLQAASPVHALGTISSTARSVQLAALVLGPLIGSNAARWITIPMVFIVSGILAVLAGLLLCASPTSSRSALEAETR
ncbi:MFS transporter [Paraburkholderia bryophila]|uniref:Putative MFS family arabinose efflux permease n=1 Tax=Paraburkholderia bryophila TaxID=420952 RepID=A0A329CUY9_9BURK|nr:MFS transporter [Paraburkholderia bryophila]RAS37451.1 putative MFS family arabinose efflux permease [Paraburkholderia bryophila]